jgi:hypothetical protein
MNIEKLLVQTKNNELEANKTLINKITVSLLLDLIKQGRPFLQNLLREQNPSTHFQRFLRDIKDYEKKSFNEVDETSQMIQKLVTNNFHCSLLNVGIPLVPKNNEQGFTLYKEAVKKIEMISDLVLEAGKSNASNEVSESRNRLFYNKLELLQTFVETYETNPSSRRK